MIGCWEVHYCCLKSYGIFYCSNVWWDHIPDANCTGVKGCTERGVHICRGLYGTYDSILEVGVSL